MIDRKTDEWGRTVFSANGVIELMMQGVDVSTIIVEDSELVTEYNNWCDTFNKDDFKAETPAPLDISPEEEHDSRTSNWMISDDIKKINVREFLVGLCKNQEQVDRVNYEMDLFEERQLIPLLQLMMFLVDRFRSEKVVWGVGRGSSVASFVLYLIGIHKIDPIKYGLDVKDFLKD